MEIINLLKNKEQLIKSQYKDFSFISKKDWNPRLTLMLKYSNAETHIDGEKNIIEFLSSLENDNNNLE